MLGPPIAPTAAALRRAAGPFTPRNEPGITPRSCGIATCLIRATGTNNARYAPSGHIVYGVGGTLRAVGFDLDSLEVTSDPAPVLEGVATKSSGAASFGISQNGSLLYIAGSLLFAGARTLVWVDREGREEPLTAEPRPYTYPQVSPDGTRLALDVRDEQNDIWIWDFARETLTRLTFDAARESYPRWTPDV